VVPIIDAFSQNSGSIAAGLRSRRGGKKGEVSAIHAQSRKRRRSEEGRRVSGGLKGVLSQFYAEHYGHGASKGGSMWGGWGTESG